MAEASLRMLASLVEKSVLQHMHDGRYHILSLLRQLAAEKLASHPAELASAQARHCDVYMTFLRERRLAAAGPDQKRVLAEVQDEMDNIRIAWAYASRHSRLEELNLALTVLFRYLWTRGRYEDGGHDRPGFGPTGRNNADEWSSGGKIALVARRAQFAAARGGQKRRSPCWTRPCPMPDGSGACLGRRSVSLRSVRSPTIWAMPTARWKI